MKNPLICPECQNYRYILFKGIGFQAENNKRLGINVPFYKCNNCLNEVPFQSQEYYEKIADEHLKQMRDEEISSIEFEYENKKFNHYNHLSFEYDSADYFLIPGLRRPNDDGFLTPVFFDKDVLLYYNNHPDYSVQLYSFSSGNIYYNGESMFRFGFGINRNDKIFMWLGDLDNDFESSEMDKHLKRFQASNVKSDHDIYSKFYLSQIPTSPSDAFQSSDNESRLFGLKNELVIEIDKLKGLRITQIEINDLSEYYKAPILEEKEQIFNTYISLNKFLVENIKVKELKAELERIGKNKKDIKSIGSLKTFQLYLSNVLKVNNVETHISPLFVLNDLRQLQGHLMNDSYIKKYNFCKDRLGLKKNSTDFLVYQTLIEKIIEFYEIILEGIKE